MEYCKNYCEEKEISTSHLNEAQKTLYYIAENMKMDKSISEEGYRHFQMAIKALRQEPCEDTVSREAVLDAMYALCDTEDKENPWRDNPHIDAIISTIDDLSPVKPQPKTGHWIVVSDGYGNNAYICECSECKDTVWVYKDADRKWNYCPNCGAKMESEE